MPRKPQKKQWKVVGAQPVLGHMPGATFEAALDPTQAEFLTSIGALAPVKSKKD